MTEPTQPPIVGLITVGIAVLGPLAGPYAVIVLSALAGALWALAATATASRAEGGMFLVRLVLTAVVLTSSCCWALEYQYGWPAHQMLAPLAFLVGLGGERWRALGDVLLSSLQKRLGGAGENK